MLSIIFLPNIVIYVLLYFSIKSRDTTLMIKKSKPFENLAYLAHSVIIELSVCLEIIHF